MAILNANVGYTQVLFKIVPNPTILLKTESGLYIGSGLHKSEETGDFEKSDAIIGFGVVQTVGPECKYLQPGDGMFFDRRSCRPVPTGEEIWNTSEQNVIAFVKKDDPSMKEAFDAYDAQEEMRKQEELKQRLAKSGDIFLGNGKPPHEGQVFHI